MIVGAEGVQNIFASTFPKIKKPVVGRGNLPPDALEILMKEAKESSESGIHEKHLSQSHDRLIGDELDNGKASWLSILLSFIKMCIRRIIFAKKT